MADSPATPTTSDYETAISEALQSVHPDDAMMDGPFRIAAAIRPLVESEITAAVEAERQRCLAIVEEAKGGSGWTLNPDADAALGAVRGALRNVGARIARGADRD